MKNTLLKTTLVLTMLVLTGAIHAQKKETVTITGKVTVKDTGKPPIGIITVLEEDAVTLWVYGDVVGTNNHTFLQKDGSFKLTINKGATILIVDNGKRYNELSIKKLDKSQNLNLKLDRITGEFKKKSKYPPNQLLKEEKTMDPSKIIKVTGKIVTIKGTPIGDVNIQQSDVFNQDYAAYSRKIPENSRRMNAFVTSAKDGTFSLRIPKGTRLRFSKSFDFKMYHFSPQKDTVINLIMERVNPFR